MMNIMTVNGARAASIEDAAMGRIAGGGAFLKDVEGGALTGEILGATAGLIFAPETLGLSLAAGVVVGAAVGTLAGTADYCCGKVAEFASNLWNDL